MINPKVENLDPMFYEDNKKLNPEHQNDNDIVVIEYCCKQDVEQDQVEEITNKSQILQKLNNLKN